MASQRAWYIPCVVYVLVRHMIDGADREGLSQKNRERMFCVRQGSTPAGFPLFIDEIGRRGGPPITRERLLGQPREVCRPRQHQSRQAITFLSGKPG